MGSGAGERRKVVRMVCSVGDISCLSAGSLNGLGRVNSASKAVSRRGAHAMLELFHARLFNRNCLKAYFLVSEFDDHPAENGVSRLSPSRAHRVMTYILCLWFARDVSCMINPSGSLDYL